MKKDKEVIDSPTFEKVAELFCKPLIYCGCNEKGHYWKYWFKCLKLYANNTKEK